MARKHLNGCHRASWPWWEYPRRHWLGRIERTVRNCCWEYLLVDSDGRHLELDWSLTCNGSAKNLQSRYQSKPIAINFLSAHLLQAACLREAWFPHHRLPKVPEWASCGRQRCSLAAHRLQEKIGRTSERKRQWQHQFAAPKHGALHSRHFARLDWQRSGST